MNSHAKHRLGYIAGLILLSSNLYAGEGHHHFSGDPVKAMAEIVIGLKHFPSKSERGQLKDISSHSDDANIKAIADALIHLRHVPKEEDKAKLEKIMQDKSANSNVRLLAKIVHDINHKPNRADKEKLSVITGH